MTHDDALARLPELLWLRHADAEEAALRAHLAECHECRQLLVRIQYVERALRATPECGPSETLASRVLAIPETPGAARRPRPRGGRLAAGAGAIAVVVAAISLAVLVTRGGGSSEPFDRGQAVAFAGATPSIRGRLEFGEHGDVNQSLRLVASGLDGPSSSLYTLWLMGPAGRVSAGTFRPDADGDCDVIGVVPSGIRWTSFSITRRAAAGAPEEAVALAEL